jgi:ATP-dependent DNA ligase
MLRYEASQKVRGSIASLLLAAKKDGKLVYVGNVGTGLFGQDGAGASCATRWHARRQTSRRDQGKEPCLCQADTGGRGKFQRLDP